MNKLTIPIITAATLAPIIGAAPNASAGTTAVSTTALHLSLSSIRSSQKAAVVPLYKGQGVTFNLSRTDEIITNIILDDHSQIVPITEVPLCPVDASSGCSSPGAKTLHLKRIDDIYKGVDERPVPKTNTPLLTVITRTEANEVRVNTFVIELASGVAKYHSVEVYPDAEYQSIFLTQNRQSESTPLASATPSSPESAAGREKQEATKPKSVAAASNRATAPRQFDLEKLKQGFERIKPRLNSVQQLAIRRMLYLVEKRQMEIVSAARLNSVSMETLVYLQKVSNQKG